MNRIVLFMALFTGSAASAGDTAPVVAAEISRLRLRPVVVVQDAKVTLADVIDFSSADARLVEAIANKPLGADVPATGELAVAYDFVNKRLAALGVNRARVLLSGASNCTIRREKPAAATVAAESAAALVNPKGGEKTTLAEMLQSRIGHELESLGGTPEVEFEAAGREFLALTAPEFDFTIRSDRPGALGLREFTVTIKRDGRFQRVIPIGAQVRLTRRVLVAARPLNVGSNVARDSLTYANQTFSSTEDLGIEHIEQVVGQQVKNFVASGELVRTRDLKAVDLVRRSQPVTVEGRGSVRIHVTGVALDNGGYGETVRVRLGDGRSNRRELRGTVTGVGTVTISEEAL